MVEALDIIIDRRPKEGFVKGKAKPILRPDSEIFAKIDKDVNLRSLTMKFSVVLTNLKK